MSEGKSAATPQWAIKAMQRMHATVCPTDCNDPECIAEVNRGAQFVAEEAALAGSVAALKAQPDTERREGWMDSIDFEHEVGHANGGNVVYPTKENLHENMECLDTDGECTAMRIYVFNADKFDAAGAPKAGEPPRALSTWLDTTLWSFVHGALLDLGLCAEASNEVLHKHMRGAILAAFQVGAGETPQEMCEKFVLELAGIYGLDENFMRALPTPTMEMWQMLVREEAKRHKSERATMEKFRSELIALKFGAGETPAERPKLTKFRCDCGLNLLVEGQVIGKEFLPPGAGSTKENV